MPKGVFKRKPFTEEHKQRIANANKGKSFSKEARKKMSLSQMGHSVSIKTRQKIRQANLGKHHSEKTKKFISKIHKGKHNSPTTEFKKGVKPWNKGKKILQIADEKHPMWKGNKVGYFGLHLWIRRKLGKATVCSFKDKTCKGMFEWANIAIYNRDLNNWKSMCRSHHRRFDNKRKKYVDN